MNTYKHEVHYLFSDLVNECDDLRIFFGVNSIVHKVNMKSFYHHYCSETKCLDYLIKQPRGKQLVEEFFNVMGYELPSILNPKIRVEAKGK